MSSSFPRLIPRALSPGDTLGIISPASPGENPHEDLRQGQAVLHSLGYNSVILPHAADKKLYLAGEDKDRLADLKQAFLDPEIDGILCARGGYGCMRLLPLLDMAWIRQHPKVFMGFSDVTALHVAFYQHAGLVGFYGSMLTSNLIHNEPWSAACLLDLVSGKAGAPYDVPNQDSYQCFTPGIAEGPLMGGNLSLLTALCGTPFQPKTQGHLLFIEDWREKFYSLDRQFQQLRLAGLFDGIRGLILCDFSEITPEPGGELATLLQELTADLAVPCGYGFSVGHGEQTATLPIGINARFDASNGKLTLLESPVQK